MNFNQKEWDDDDFFETLKQKYPFVGELLLRQ